MTMLISHTQAAARRLPAARLALLLTLLVTILAACGPGGGGAGY